jgi:cytochrome c-type biogenesis protein CcmH/NrfG
MKPRAQRARRSILTACFSLVGFMLVLLWRWSVGLDFLDLVCLVIVVWSMSVAALGYLTLGLWMGVRRTINFMERQAAARAEPPARGEMQDTAVIPAPTPHGRGDELTSPRRD